MCRANPFCEHEDVMTAVLRVVFSTRSLELRAADKRVADPADRMLRLVDTDGNDTPLESAFLRP